MELEHNFTVAAPVEQAWEVLLDLERIAPCMPGATLTSHDDEAFTGNVRVKLGPVTMTFSGQGRFVERDPATRRIVVEASGKDKRGGGTARASIRASLQPDGDGTAVAVHSDLVVTGRIAQFGRGMIADVSTRLLGQFTDCLSGEIGAAPEPAAAVTAREPAAAVTAPEAPGKTAPEPPGKTAPAETAPAEAGPATLPPAMPEPATAPIRPPVASQPSVSASAARPPEPAAPAEPIDLLGVTGIRAAAGRFLPYLLVFVLGGLVGGGLVALLAR